MSRFIALDDRALAYARAELRHANPLGRELLRAGDLERGSWYAVVPNEPHGDVYEFCTGLYRQQGQSIPTQGGYVQAVRSTEADVASWAMGILTRHPSWGLISESYLLRKGDLRRGLALPGKTFALDDFVYHRAAGSDPADVVLSIVQTIYAVPLGVGALIAGQFGSSSDEGPEDTDVNRLAQQTKSILLGAYDGESVLVWIPVDGEMAAPGM